MIRRLRLLTPAVAALLLMAAPAAAPRAQVEVDIDKGQVQAMPLAVADMAGVSQGAEISRIVAADLERSGLFRLLPRSAFPTASPDVSVQPDVAAWRAAGAQDLVAGRATLDADGRLRVDFRLWDTAGGHELVGAQFTSTPENFRRLAHKVADAVYKRLTGEDGYFDSRVVFVAESGGGKGGGRTVKRLAIMDQDGANPVFLTDGPEQVLTPRFNATGRQIAYMSLRADSARVHVFDVETARRESLGDFPGYAYAPRFSPDGTKVAFSLNTNGNSDIEVMDLATHAAHRITNDPGIDTSPAYSPDGSRMVFNSDRGGSPQLYVMPAGGGPAHRVSFGGGRYTAPVWSPKGDLIAFVRQDGSRFHIGVMRPEGGGERLLTTSYLDEAPTFAPNGRVLMYAHQGSAGAPSRLYTVDVQGRARRAVPYTGAASDPSWSPLLK